MRTFKAGIKDRNGHVVWVEIQAQTAADARSLLESQYGKAAIAHGPFSV